MRAGERDDEIGERAQAALMYCFLLLSMLRVGGLSLSHCPTGWPASLTPCSVLDFSGQSYSHESWTARKPVPSGFFARHIGYQPCKSATLRIKLSRSLFIIAMWMVCLPGLIVTLTCRALCFVREPSRTARLQVPQSAKAVQPLKTLEEARARSLDLQAACTSGIHMVWQPHHLATS